MRALALMCILLALVFASTSAEEAKKGPLTGLQGSKHDFSAESWTGGDLCIACHSESPAEFPAEPPLWSSAADFNRTFGDAVKNLPHGRKRSVPGNGTLVCMRCHDGTVATDMFGGLSAPAAINSRHAALPSTAHGGTNHPVGLEYPQFDAEYRPMNLVLAEGKILLPGGKIECSSCHDPHNETGAAYMLTKTNERSSLCLSCHKK